MKRNATVLMVYMTAANQAEAKRLARHLVEQKVAACVNILGAISSVYEWKGKVENAKEIALVAKTTTAAYPKLERIVKANHSYECPCIVAWKIDQGNPPFLQWVGEQAAK